MKYYEKKYDIDGELFIGRIINPDVDCQFYFEHQKLNMDEHKHFLDTKEVKKMIDALEDLLFSEEVKE